MLTKQNRVEVAEKRAAADKRDRAANVAE